MVGNLFEASVQKILRKEAVERPEPMNPSLHAKDAVLHEDAVHDECLPPPTSLQLSQEVDPL